MNTENVQYQIFNTIVYRKKFQYRTSIVPKNSGFPENTEHPYWRLNKIFFEKFQDFVWIFREFSGFLISFRNISTGATGATAVAPKFSDTLNLSPPGGGGQILPIIAEVPTKLSPWLRLCTVWLESNAALVKLINYVSRSNYECVIAHSHN